MVFWMILFECFCSDVDEDVVSLKQFSTELIVANVVRCLKVINNDLELPNSLPPGMSARFRVGASLATHIQVNMQQMDGFKDRQIHRQTFTQMIADTKTDWRSVQQLKFTHANSLSTDIIVKMHMCLHAPIQVYQAKTCIQTHTFLCTCTLRTWHIHIVTPTCMQIRFPGPGLHRGCWIPDLPVLQRGWHQKDLHVPGGKTAQGNSPDIWRTFR